jgi:predicted membrane channel-forming protein YqfA (hemolysin III family)
VHFQFGDYAKLTVIGVLIACAAWPVTTRITSQPRWMFFRMAVLVTLVLWLPDVYILMKGQPGKAVAVLFVMHVAIALVTYNALVRLAPVHARRYQPQHAQPVTR